MQIRQSCKDCAIERPMASRAAKIGASNGARTSTNVPTACGVYACFAPTFNSTWPLSSNRADCTVQTCASPSLRAPPCAVPWSSARTTKPSKNFSMLLGNTTRANSITIKSKEPPRTTPRNAEVLNTLERATRPSTWRATQSVNVPPVSTPISHRMFSRDWPRNVCCGSCPRSRSRFFPSAF